MKNTLKDNPYLENIIKGIDKNLKWIEEHPEADKIGMLKVVIAHCFSKIKEIPPVEHEYDK